MDELRSLASELLRTGKLTAKEKTSYTPPPLQPGSVVGSCTDGD